MKEHFNFHSMKRAAHQEGWYDAPWNPFGRSRTHSPSTRNTTRDVDVEHGEGGSPGLFQQRRPDADSTIRRDHDHGASPISTDGANGNKALDEKSNDTAGINAAKNSDETNVESQTVGVDDTKSQSGLFGKLRHRGKKEELSHATTTTSNKSGKRSLKHKKFTVANQIKGTIFNSWINILLLAAPVGIALNYTPVRQSQPIVIFLVNLIAILPLAALLSYATEEIALRVGEVLGGLLNASFGNAVELIVAIIALVQGETTIVKTSLIGSILSNLLLVMGMCFFFGGLRRSEQFFNQTVATTAASLLALAIAALIIPTAFDISTQNTETQIASISRGVSVILLLIYGCYLFFQLHTHAAMYQQESQKVAMRPRKNHVEPGTVFRGLAVSGAITAAPARVHTVDESGEARDIMNPHAFTEQQELEDNEPDEPNLHIWVAIGLLGAATVVIALCAEYMVGSISDFTEEYNVSTEFVGLILLPIVGNAAEHATAVTVACKDKMDLAIGVAVGSSMQIALLVLPFAVILGWILGQPDMNLSFDGFQIAVLFVAVLLVNYLIGDGKSHWLEGALLQSLYIIIALSAWFYPINATDLTGT